MAEAAPRQGLPAAEPGSETVGQPDDQRQPGEAPVTPALFFIVGALVGLVLERVWQDLVELFDIWLRDDS